jgi:hypothetical protein
VRRAFEARSRGEAHVSSIFHPDAPFRPVRVRSTHADGDTVIVVWDGEGTTRAGGTCSNVSACLTTRDGRVVDGTAFDSIAFDELWHGVPADSVRGRAGP